MYSTDQMIHPNHWYFISKGLNTLGRLPTHTSQTKTLHISRQWKKALRFTYFFFFRDNMTKQLPHHNLVSCIFLLSIRETISMHKIKILKYDVIREM